jgi:phosphoribosyl-ATP pyrophosphohydrolase
MSDNLSQADILARVAATLESRKPENGGDPEKSYVAKLFKGRRRDSEEDRRGSHRNGHGRQGCAGCRLGRRGRGKVVYEVADLWFHTMVLLARIGLTPEDVVNELARREGCPDWSRRPAARSRIRVTPPEPVRARRSWRA